MAKKFELYKCQACGILTEVFHSGKGVMSCCGKPMELMTEDSVEAATEKHIPVIEKTETGYKVSVGSVLHPMTEEHYIEWIEVFNGNRQRIFHLNPGDAPVIEVTCPCDISNLTARAYCNLHGHWKNA